MMTKLFLLCVMSMSCARFGGTCLIRSLESQHKIETVSSQDYYASDSFLSEMFMSKEKEDVRTKIQTEFFPQSQSLILSASENKITVTAKCSEHTQFRPIIDKDGSPWLVPWAEKDVLIVVPDTAQWIKPNLIFSNGVFKAVD